MTSVKEDCGSTHSAEVDREREREREREHENELLQSPSKFKAQTQNQAQAPETEPETGACKTTEKYVRVRDMINLYNFAMQKNQELEHAKSILFGSSSQSAGSDMPGDMPSDNPGDMPSEEKVDGGQDNPCPAVISQFDEKLTLEKSYRSKTTIRRTDQGVRIIIDIYMDKNDSDIDIVGSRVETEIPESRVLADFQKKSLEIQKLKAQLKQEQEQAHDPKTVVQDQVDERT